MMAPVLPGILSAEPFVPHTLAHLVEKRVFPSPLPEVAYNKMLAEYAVLVGVEVFSIAYESDGLRITGVMALPKPLPASFKLIVYNRGGSRDYGKLTLLNVLRSMAPFAQEGYVVLASNYRGNGGSEGVEEFGGADVRDVLRLLEIGRALPGFDGKNAFMIGHSRGGMMTELAIKQGAEVNAAVAIAGIADARKLVQAENLLEHVLKPLVPGFDRHPHEVLEGRSAVLWPEAITVPLLLLHADNDRDVGVDDSIALHEAIKAAGGVSELVVYEGGGHALLRHWDDVLARCKDWLEQYSA